MPAAVSKSNQLIDLLAAPATPAKTAATTSAAKPAAKPAPSTKPAAPAKPAGVKAVASKPSAPVKEMSKDQKSALTKLAKEHPNCGLDDGDSLLSSC